MDFGNFEGYADELGEEAALYEWGDDVVSEELLAQEAWAEQCESGVGCELEYDWNDDPTWLGQATDLPVVTEHRTGVASYDLVLDVIGSLEDCEPAQMEDLLRRIRAAKDDLYPRFRTAGRPVVVDYGGRFLQYAYLLAYYPTYVEQAVSALQSAESSLVLNGYPSLANDEILKVSIFGAGPAPEVVGLLRFLDMRSRRMLIARLFDRQPLAWAEVRETSMQRARWEREVSVSSEALACDLSSANPFTPYREQVASSRIIWFQNCLNEVTLQASAGHALVDAMSVGSVLLVGQVGRPDHPSINVATLINAAGPRLRILRAFTSASRVGSEVPQPVQDLLALPVRSIESWLFVAVRT